MIIDRLIERIIATKNPSVVGLDPRLEYIPAYIMKEAKARHTEPLQAAAWAVWMYNRALIDALCDIVPAVKPQIAFYEVLGAAGIECYIKTIAYAREKGLIIISDIKRGDIASTAQAYADAHIGRVKVDGQSKPIFDADFVTLNPYLGFDTVEPFLNHVRAYDKGVFVLVRTSNPGAGDIQDLETPNGKVYEAVADRVAQWNEGMEGTYGYGPVCAVVGATYPAQAAALRTRIPRVFFLVPGYGAQGASANDIRASFHADGMGALVNNSRGIIAAHMQATYQNVYPEESFALAARDAAMAMRNELGYNYETCH